MTDKRKCAVLSCDRAPKQGRDPRVIYARCDFHTRQALTRAFATSPERSGWGPGPAVPPGA